MLKRLILCLTVICMVITFPSCTNKNNKGDDNLISSENSIPHPSDNYSREENFEYFNNNYDLINEIIVEMKKYDFIITFGIQETIVCITDDESNKALVMENEELISNVTQLLEDDILNFIEKSVANDEGDFQYLLHLTIPKKGYSCFFSLEELEEPASYMYKVKDNWYYSEMQNV